MLATVLDAIMSFLSLSYFSLFGVPVTMVEILGFVSGALCVYLAARNNIWTWPVGIVNVSLFLVLFTQAGLYADAALQVVYLVLSVYGWVVWSRRPAGFDAMAGIRSWGSKERWILLGALLLGTVAIYLVLTRQTDSTVPVPDAFTTAGSLVAQWLLSTKKVETWWFWLMVDVIYVPLYAIKGLYLTSILYVVFFGLSLLGLLSWRKARRGDQEAGLSSTQTGPGTAPLVGASR